MIWIFTLLRTLLCCGLSFNTVWGHLFLGGHFRPFNPNIYENANNGNVIAQGTCAFITDVLIVPSPLMGGDIYQWLPTVPSLLRELWICVCMYWNQCRLSWWKACIYLCSVYSELAIPSPSGSSGDPEGPDSVQLWYQLTHGNSNSSCSVLHSFQTRICFIHPSPSFSMPSLQG